MGLMRSSEGGKAPGGIVVPNNQVHRRAFRGGGYREHLSGVIVGSLRLGADRKKKASAVDSRKKT